MTEKKKLATVARNCGSIFAVDFDDLDALLQLAGVVSALVVTVIIGFTFCVTAEEFARYDFVTLMRFSEFRHFAVGVMDGEFSDCVDRCNVNDAGSFCIAGCNKEAMDWTFANPATGQSWDLRSAMLEPVDYDYATYVPEYEAVTHLLEAVFPMEKMLAWSTMHDPGQDFYHPSATDILYPGLWSICLTTVSFMASILLYIALQFSDARDGGSDLGVWATAGVVGVIMVFVALNIGTGLFTYSAGAVTWSRFPAAREVTRQLSAGPRWVSWALTFLSMAFCVTMVIVVPLYRKVGRRSTVVLPHSREEDGSTGDVDRGSASHPHGDTCEQPTAVREEQGSVGDGAAWLV